VVIIGQDNVFTIPYPSIIAKWNENGVDNINLYINKDAEVLNRLFKAKLNPYYIDVYYYSNIPRLNNDGEPFMIDGDHYSKFGSDLVVKKIFNDTLFKKQILDK
jgi:hypothetical protein